MDGGFSKLGFPCLLETDEIALYVLENFEWYRRKVAFHPLPLPSDYGDLCSNFDLAVAEEAARDFDLSVILQVGHNRSNILRACRLEAGSDQEEEEDSGSGEASPSLVMMAMSRGLILCGHATEGLSLMRLASRVHGRSDLPQGPVAGPSARQGCEVMVASLWTGLQGREILVGASDDRSRGAARPPRLLPENYHKLCPPFDLLVAEEAAPDFCIVEMIQAVFYAMVVNEALELGVLSGDLAEHLKLWLEGLWWYICEVWLQLNKLDLWWVLYCRRANPGAEARPLNN
ncbi:hypothetical protein Cgig2_031604 [Carnegiea gigantea]|uniref:Uncharacterized protein n=1 Tax=Carnegiea gigantea TaxID=171969 RepID=A0A9Q1K0S4_9CARY|nr:hypothetical protein Cgig2_031604 [Carnegiea gigantea]